MLVSFWVLFRKEISRFMRVWSQTVFSPLINATLYILVFGISLSALLKNQTGYTYLEFLIPGLVAMSSLNNSLTNSASSIMSAKFHNDLQDLKIIPLEPVLIAMAYSLAGIVRGFLCGALVFCVGQIFVYFQTGSFFQVHHPLALIAFLFLGCSFFGSLGIWTGFISKSFDHVNAISQFIVMPLIYLGGVFYSLSSLHPFWQQVARVNPLVYIINGIRWSVLGVSDFSVGLCLAVCFAFFLFGIFIAIRGVTKGNYTRF